MRPNYLKSYSKNHSTSKVLVLCGTLLAALGMTACQTSPPPKPDQAMRHLPDAAARPDKHHKMRHMDDRMQARWNQLSPEQKAKFEQRRSQANLDANAHKDRRENPHKNQHEDQRKIQWQQVQQACQGQPAGQVIQVKINDQVINGRCELRFVKDRTSS